ncbi:hypothetical protein KJZ63_03690 [Patescibacteria group bacterium]|nr:hypothetical protein [Patescibacteria group bacterium]
MNKSNFELFRRDHVGKLNIGWQGLEPNEPPFTARIIEALNQINQLVIVVESNPNTIQTCLRMLFSLTKQLEARGIKNEVVLSEPNTFEAAEMTGFDRFFHIWPNEQQAAQALGIIDLYPLILIENYAGTPDPIVA